MRSLSIAIAFSVAGLGLLANSHDAQAATLGFTVTSYLAPRNLNINSLFDSNRSKAVIKQQMT